MKPIKILIADDHAIVRLGLSALFRYQKDMKLVGEADDGESLLKIAAESHPDVIIMDLMMPVMDGVEAIRHILAPSSASTSHSNSSTHPRILILTSFGSSAELSSAVKAGAAGVILKGAPPETLLDAIHTVMNGETYFSDEVKRTLVREDLVELTERQSQVLTLLSQGKSNPEIASALGISTDAVKQHLAAVYSKLGATNRADAVSIAIRKHLLRF